MSSAIQTPANSAAAADAAATRNPLASFGTALLGFMVSTTLATSLMVLLSQG